MDFSLFCFAHDGTGDTRRIPYDLLLEAARLADRHGFAAVWAPEPHFHPFGGLRPNPAQAAAAVAAVTERVEIRAGSVVGPDYDLTRFAQEWATVDNLSGGRVALSFGPGWPGPDFVLAPEDYPQRREALMRTLGTVRQLWHEGATGTGADRIFPAPVRPEVPVWLTSAGSAGSFREAGELGVGVLTHLLCQSLEELAEKTAVYREAYTGTGAPRVALLLPALLGPDRAAVRQAVRAPFLRTDAGRLRQAPGEVLRGVDPADLDPEDLEFLVERAFDRHVGTGGLFGRVEDAAGLLDRVAAAGVDEVACMVDFDLETSTVHTGLGHLAALKDTWRAR
ncbi:MupA/Atu3671 family FMN-dependent luciferase-like monooxygenase [Kitasatospora viridis]|uniref:Natural product biosynthesis luciferase-like monooxygenase protein n=1 Tax=Kitasatospora viridis TaxID=281105 RepID=A0A561SG12_9ACTN|nr:MupA/Atu3671 family FMN-dependent luciferase-like monooxygenase [Kitasatospora viridis]TWF73810.1 natural product biosynthesis luciferase-like monooxygenase protein [Kitasatospora viridis]